MNFFTGGLIIFLNTLYSFSVKSVLFIYDERIIVMIIITIERVSMCEETNFNAFYVM